MRIRPSGSSFPIVDVASLVGCSGPRALAAERIGVACREHGFFYAMGHGVPDALQSELERLSREFFARSSEEKREIRMSRGGRAWRGYFAVGEELTSGVPDLKEGLYFGAELDGDHPLVRTGTPMHGPNLFPSSVPRLRDAVLDYMAAMTRLGHALMEGVALSLGLEPDYFARRYTADPLVLFRVFHYPPNLSPAGERWGVGEHTDYGFLTILKQDDVGGLQVKCGADWIDAPPVPGTFVCNIGDMLDRLTGGLYHSTAHRVRNTSERGRLSFPFFFDPNYETVVRRLEGVTAPVEDRQDRWDGASVHEVAGTYGDHLLAKVAKVFPQLRSGSE
jgi:isopenicillin N synthase-like dioxygenase